METELNASSFLSSSQKITLKNIYLFVFGCSIFVTTCGLCLVEEIRGYSLVVCGLSGSVASLVEHRFYDT